MVVDLINHRKPDGATKSTVFGPFHRLGAPELPAGGNIARLDKTGIPTLVSGRVLDLDGQPIEGALLDVWQTQSSGLYNSQDDSLDGELHMRGRFHTDAEGRYLIRTVLPVNYPIPSDGPSARCCARPAAIRGARRTSTSSFQPTAMSRSRRTSLIARDEYLGSDAVFAVKDSLICDFVRHDSAVTTPRGSALIRLTTPPNSISALKPAAERKATVLDAQRGSPRSALERRSSREIDH